jgi:flagellar assembly factor FliW
MLPLEIPAQRPLVYLQSVESAEVCFVGLPVYAIDPGFKLRISDEDRSTLLLPEGYDPVIGVDVLCLALLMPATGQTVRVNMNAAIVISLHSRRGVQCTPPAGIAACFRLSADNGWTPLC